MCLGDVPRRQSSAMDMQAGQVRVTTGTGTHGQHRYLGIGATEQVKVQQFRCAAMAGHCPTSGSQQSGADPLDRATAGNGVETAAYLFPRTTPKEVTEIRATNPGGQGLLACNEFTRQVLSRV